MKEKNLKRIGENIRAARKSKNLTIETLSELAGVSESFLGTVERGESSISIETLISLCKALDVSADSLIICGKETIPALSDKRDTLLTMLKNATDEELGFLIDYVKLYRGRVKFQAGHQ
jgi:transcriptional regulator with XRE-family HTH domain